MIIKIDRRFPFGFKGNWSKCYKKTNYNDTQETIEYSRTTYYDVGFDVQLKHIEDGVDKSIINSQPIQNLITKGGYIITKTTDAHFRDDIKNYECIIEINDIVFFENEYWIVEKIDERSIYTPKKQTIYYIIMKNIFKDVIVGVNRSVKEDV